MDSVNVFEGKTLKPPRKTRSLMLVLILASILPGAGHLLLGRKTAGFWLLGGFVFGQILASVAHLLGAGPLYWLGLRAVILIYLFGVVDSALLQAEIRDRRDGDGEVRPRMAAFGNLLLYGQGYWRLDEKGWAAVAIAFGGLFHGFIGSIHMVLQAVMELAMCGLAFHAHRMATEAAMPRDDKSLDFTPRQRVADSTPGWLMPVLTAFCVFQIGFLGLVAYVGTSLSSAMEVDQSRSLAVEPYYQNKDYGVQIEMNAPGWSFLQAAEDEFVSARHVSEKSSMRLILRPRVFGYPRSESYAQILMGEAMVAGNMIEEQISEPATVAGLEGWRVRGISHYGGQRKNFELRTAGRGWHQYSLWFEWDQNHSDFGESELAHVVSGLHLANSTEVPIEASAAR